MHKRKQNKAKHQPFLYWLGMAFIMFGLPIAMFAHWLIIGY